MRILPAPGKAALLSFVLGSFLLALGSIVSIHDSWPGQVVLSIFAGAGFVAVGALRLSMLLALRPRDADELLGGARASEPVPCFRDFPGLRWALVVVLFVVFVGAAMLVASDVHAWSRLRWAMPADESWLVLG